MRNIFKIASLLAAAVMLFACDGLGDTNVDESGAALVLTADKDVIQADGKDAVTFKVMLGDKDVTAEAEIYDEDDALAVLTDGKFTATEVGEYKFYANYGTLTTYSKSSDDNGYYVVKAINVAVPAAPVDPYPQSTDFVHRAFLTQYTGTGCGYCPLMIKVLRELSAERVIPEKAVHAAVHSYGAGDPAYINAPRVSNYPYLTVDLVQGFSAEQGAATLKNYVEIHSGGLAKASISVNPCYYVNEATLVVKVAVKAAEDGIFNVGAWLLEDGIYGQQSDYKNVGDESYNTHENCVRIADSKYSGTWFGHPLGTLSKGGVAEKTFVMNINSKWKVENLHLAVFVSHGVANGSRLEYTVCNAVDVPIGVETRFEYAK